MDKSHSMFLPKGNAIKMIKYIHKGDLDAMSSLLQSKVSANSTYQELSLLMYACRYNNIGIVQLLLKNKADPAYIAPGRGSVLNHVQGNRKMLNLLLQYGADPNKATPKHGSTLLLDAIGKRDIDLTRMLVDAKADVNKRNSEGMTPLRMATNMGYVIIVRDAW